MYLTEILDEVEFKNTQILKKKLKLYRNLKKNSDHLEELIKSVNSQKEAFKLLNNVKFFLFNDKGFKFNYGAIPLNDFLAKKFMEANKVICTLLKSYEAQFSILSSAYSIEEKQKRLSAPFRDELEAYKEYQNLRKKIPQQIMERIKVEIENKLKFNIESHCYILRIIVYTFIVYMYAGGGDKLPISIIAPMVPKEFFEEEYFQYLLEYSIGILNKYE